MKVLTVEITSMAFIRVGRPPKRRKQQAAGDVQFPYDSIVLKKDELGQIGDLGIKFPLKCRTSLTKPSNNSDLQHVRKLLRKVRIYS